MRSLSAATPRMAKRAALLLAILTIGIQLWAQVPSVANGQDPFVHLDAALSSAADGFLTAAAQSPASTGSAVAFNSPAAAVASDPRPVDSRQSWQRVERLRPLIDPILHEEGVPTELAAVALVESGGQPAALSPKGARGIWQFMPDTARRYGLAVDPSNDERLDLLKSTRAAARYLRNLHDRFDSWPLALAAYNAGEDKVQRAMDRTDGSTFADFSRLLPFETQNYVPAVIAAARGFGGQSLLRTRGLRPSKPVLVVYAAADSRH